jgi:hypothetical protein
MANNNDIYATALKGYCNMAVCWQFMHDISSSLENIHSRNKAHGKVSLGNVIVEGRHFKLVENCSGAEKEEDIWCLAASAMELMLGSSIFNGKGEGEINTNTPIPSLAAPEAEKLNALLVQCLSPVKEKRATATQIKDIAAREINRTAEKRREPKMQKEFIGETTVEEIDSKWPDNIFTQTIRSIIVLLIFLTGTQTMNAQTLEEAGEHELLQMRNAVLLLRNDNEKSWNKAQDELDKLKEIFTLMDELRDSKNDCKPISSEVKRFGVNIIVSELKNGRRIQLSNRELLDGSDERFDFSMFEKCIKKNSTATYKMTGRYGKQVFLVIPYRSGNKYSCSLQFGERAPLKPDIIDKNGISYFFIDANEGPSPEETTTLKITNKKNGNASFVIMNHNYREK